MKTATVLLTLVIVGWKIFDYQPHERASVNVHDDELASLNWISFGDALRAGEATGRTTMVFVYADWCPWCQKTFKETFTNEQVRRYLAENFHVVKLNTDAATPAIKINDDVISESELSMILGAKSLPTYVFLDAQGKPLTRTEGFYPAPTLLKVLTAVVEHTESG